MAEQALIKVLSQSIPRGLKAMEPHRETRRVFLDHLRGNRYGSGPGGQVAPRPLNLINQAIMTLVPMLAWDNPKFSGRAKTVALRPNAATLAAAANHIIEEIRFNDTLRSIITDAFVGPGIGKLGVCPDYRFESPKGYLHDPGQIFFDRVSLDHYAIDPDARTREEALWEGDRYRIPKAWALESGIYDKSVVEKLDSVKEKDPKMAESLSNRGIASRQREGEVEYVYFFEAWLPQANLIATVPAPHGNMQDLPVEEILRISEHIGPEAGPYEMLGFQWLPDNVLPVPPAGIWFELADAGEKVMRAAVKQSIRQKNVLAYQRSAERDAKLLEEAEDGDRVPVDNINALQMMQWGGLEKTTIEALAVIIEQFSRVSGNTDQLGGIRSNESTATQAEILDSNARIRVGDMRNAVNTFVRRQGQKIAWHIFTDPLFSMKIIRRVVGVDVEIVYDETVREGDWLDYNIELIPSSTRPKDPEARLRAFKEWIAEIVLPSVEMANLTAGMFNPTPLIRVGADLYDIAELDEIWPDPQIVMERLAMSMMGPDPATGMVGGPMGQPGMGQPGVNQPGGMGSRGTRFNRQDGPRDRRLRSGEEKGDGSKLINRTRGDRLQRA